MAAGQSNRAYDMYQQALRKAEFVELSDLININSNLHQFLRRSNMRCCSISKYLVKFHCARCLLSANDYNGALGLFCKCGLL